MTNVFNKDIKNMAGTLLLDVASISSQFQHIVHVMKKCRIIAACLVPKQTNKQHQMEAKENDEFHFNGMILGINSHTQICDAAG